MARKTQVVAHHQPTIPIDAIIPNPDQPRRTFESEKLEEMAESVRLHGVQQPIGVAPVPAEQMEYLKKRMQERLAEDSEDPYYQLANNVITNCQSTIYMIVYGERRWRGSILAGKVDIPATIRDMDAKAVATMALIENMQRESVLFTEEARAIANWMLLQGLDPKELKDRKKAAAGLGKTLTYISWRLDALQLQPNIQQAVDDGKLTHHQVLNIAWLETPEQQQKLFDLIIQGKCPTSSHVEAAVKALKEKADEKVVVQTDLGISTVDKSKAIATNKKIEKLCDEFMKMNQSGSEFDEGIKQMSVGELQFIARQLESLEKLIRSIHKNKILTQEQAVMIAQMKAEVENDETEF